MLFNSFEFIFLFLPIVFLVYFFLNRKRLFIVSKSWLAASSLFFYSWWNVAYLPLMLASLFCNYAIGSVLSKDRPMNTGRRKAVLFVGVAFNVGLLVYFKYSDFFITNINALFSTNIPLLKMLLPLAISFFTFQQIGYLVDAYRHETKVYDFINYALFVTFFPQLIAGPIVNHKEIIPQFEQLENKEINYRNIALGVFIFSMGLFKKVIIADTFAIWATAGFDQTEILTFFEGWITSLSYTFQLYFDFSGYTDMAIGAALLFNIILPVNFNSPYKAFDIQDFWKRWHITLTRFLTRYIYIPLGGNRKGKKRTYINILMVFLISGMWHGAGWTFIFWGLLHGVATVISSFWKSLGFKLNKIFAWFITFNFVNMAWVFFRATTWEDAIKVLKGMLGLNGFALPTYFREKFLHSVISKFDFTPFFMSNIELGKATFAIIISFLICLTVKNSVDFTNSIKPNFKTLIFTLTITLIGIFSLNKVSEFLYFNF